MYHLQVQRDDGSWHIIESGGDLAHLTRRRQAFQTTCGLDRDRVRVIAAEAPGSRLVWRDREASGLVTFVTLALVCCLIAVIGLSLR